VKKAAREAAEILTIVFPTRIVIRRRFGLLNKAVMGSMPRACSSCIRRKVDFGREKKAISEAEKKPERNSRRRKTRSSMLCNSPINDQSEIRFDDGLSLFQT
jgi:hypothetical protein